MRERFSFAEFTSSDRYRTPAIYPVYVQFQEDEDGDLEKVLDIDLICEWRLQNKRPILLAVSFDTQEELETLKMWVDYVADQLYQLTSSRVYSLEFPFS